MADPKVPGKGTIWIGNIAWLGVMQWSERRGTVQTHQQDDKTPRSLLLRWGKSKRRPRSYSVQTHSSRQCDSYIPEMIGCIQHHLIHDVGCYVQRLKFSYSCSTAIGIFYSVSLRQLGWESICLLGGPGRWWAPRNGNLAAYWCLDLWFFLNLNDLRWKKLICSVRSPCTCSAKSRKTGGPESGSRAVASSGASRVKVNKSRQDPSY